MLLGRQSEFQTWADDSSASILPVRYAQIFDAKWLRSSLTSLALGWGDPQTDIKRRHAMLHVPCDLQSLTKTSFSRAEMRLEGLRSHT